LNKTQIEKKAVNIMREFISMFPNLDENFETDDKNISWDGEILLYKLKDSVEFSKKNFLNKIAVQIKGREVKTKDDLSNGKMQFDYYDLKNYAYNNGCIIFLVNMLVENNTVKQHKIFFKTFNNLNFVLLNPKIKMPTIKFLELNKESKENFIGILLGFVEANKGAQIYLNEDFLIDNLDKYTFRYISVDGTKNMSDLLFNDEKFANMTGYFLIEMDQGVFSYKAIDDNVSKKEIKFKHPFRFNSKEFIMDVTRTSNEVKYEYKDILKISSKKSNKKSGRIDMYYNLDCENKIILDLLEVKEFIEYLIDTEVMSKDRQLIELLNSIKEYNSFLDKFTSLNKNNCIFKASKKSRKNIPNEELKLTSDLKIVIGNIENLRLIYLINDKENLLIDVFDEDLNMYIKLEEKYLTNVVYFINICGFDTIKNVDNFIFTIDNKIFEENKFLKIEYSMFNDTILTLLKLYDLGRNVKIEAVKKLFNEYFKINNIEMEIIDVLNKYQIIKRIRKLSQEEIKEIISMKNSNLYKNYDIVCGCCCLLNNKEEFKIYFDNLSKEEKIGFREYPMYNLLNMNLD